MSGGGYFSWIPRKRLSEEVTRSYGGHCWLAKPSVSQPPFKREPRTEFWPRWWLKVVGRGEGGGRWRGCPEEASAFLKRQASTTGKSLPGPPAFPVTVGEKVGTAERLPSVRKAWPVCLADSSLQHKAPQLGSLALRGSGKEKSRQSSKALQW